MDEQNQNQYQPEQQPAYQSPAPQQPVYQTQPPVYPNQVPLYQPPEDNSPLSIGDYVVMLIVTAIPLVGLIMLFVWGFGNQNVNRKNFARAELIMVAIAVVLSIIFGASMVAWISSIAGGLPGGHVSY